MLNGATIRLLSTHAAKAITSNDFNVLPGFSFVASDGRAA
jgi:hypothetical protein